MIKNSRFRGIVPPNPVVLSLNSLEDDPVKGIGEGGEKEQEEEMPNIPTIIMNGDTMTIISSPIKDDGDDEEEDDQMTLEGIEEGEDVEDVEETESDQSDGSKDQMGTVVSMGQGFLSIIPSVPGQSGFEMPSSSEAAEESVRIPLTCSLACRACMYQLHHQFIICNNPFRNAQIFFFACTGFLGTSESRVCPGRDDDRDRDRI